MKPENATENLTEELVNFRLVQLSWVSNRRVDQTRMLFEFCDFNFDKLLELEAKFKRHQVYVTPGEKEKVEKLLLVKDFDEKVPNYNARVEMMKVLGYGQNRMGLDATFEQIEEEERVLALNESDFFSRKAKRH